MKLAVSLPDLDLVMLLELNEEAGSLTIERFEEIKKFVEVVEEITEEEKLKRLQRRAAKPPAEGPCKRCGLDKPLNRLFLCYGCWVKVELEARGWKEGQPHLASCNCDLDCRFDKPQEAN